MERIEKGIVFDIQGFSVYDGPGCRTVVFLKGCPLKCKWCANPEGIKPFVEIMYNSDKCILDKCCINACPLDAIQIIDNMLRFDMEKCRKCKTHDCIDACCSGALKLAGYEISIDELFEQVNRDRQYWGEGGGITFTGGEPFLQHDFLYEMLKKCYKSYIHTAVETCGCVPWNSYEKCLPFLDWIFFDVKHLNSKDHKWATGAGNEQILDNLFKIAEKFEGELILRVPVIPGYNNTDDNINSLIELVKKIETLKKVKVNILPMHHLAKEKYKMLQQPYSMDGYEAASKEVMHKFEEKLTAEDISCYIGSDTPF